MCMLDLSIFHLHLSIAHMSSASYGFLQSLGAVGDAKSKGEQVEFEVVTEKGKRKAKNVSGPGSDDPLAKEWSRQIHNPWKRCRPCHDIQATLPVCEKYDICSIDQRCIAEYHEEEEEW